MIPAAQEALQMQGLHTESPARTAFCMLSMIFAGVKRALVAGGDAAGEHSIIFQPQIRKSLSVLIDNLRGWLGSSPEHVLENGFTPEVEERKLFEIADCLLQGYVHEVTLSHGDNEIEYNIVEQALVTQPQNWKKEYLAAKVIYLFFLLLYTVSNRFICCF